MNWHTRRKTAGPGGAPVVGSMAVHVVVFLLLWGTTLEADSLEYLAIDIELVSLPAAEVEADPVPPPPEEEELIVDTPEPVPIPEEPEAIVESEEPEPPPPTPDPEPEEPEPEPAAEETAPEEGGDDLNVRMEGLQRDFPEYYTNIIRQLRRCFRWQGRGDLAASIDFVLASDGSVLPSTMRVSEQSGSVVFDLTVMEAVECAGSGRFGPLPEAMTLESLPIRFTFSPSGTGPRRPPGDADAAAGIRRLPGDADAAAGIRRPGTRPWAGAAPARSRRRRPPRPSAGTAYWDTWEWSR